MDMKLWNGSFLLSVLVTWSALRNFFRQPNICEISMYIMRIFSDFRVESQVVFHFFSSFYL
jgi:hypothetical protein